MLAREWLALKQGEWTPGQYTKERDWLENHAFPWLGHPPVADLGVAEIRPLLVHVVKRGHIEQAHRLRHQLSRVFRFAVATERATRDPAADLRDTLPARQPKNYPTITDPLKVGELLRAMDGFTGIRWTKNCPPRTHALPARQFPRSSGYFLIARKRRRGGAGLPARC